MAYSRWSNSVWYTYWASGPSDDENIENQYFAVCGVCTLNYLFIRDSIEQAVDIVKEEVESNEKYNSEDIGKAEYEELKGYMRQFVKDMRYNFDES